MQDSSVVWFHKIEKNTCDLRSLEGFEKKYLLRQGISLLKDWPADAEIGMNPDNPTDTMLVDSLFNVSSMLVISERLKAFIESADVEDCEFLPVKIRDHKNKHIAESYFIVNFVNHHDCLDKKASKAKDALVSGYIRNVRGIVFNDNEKIKNLKMFRILGFGIPTIISSEFAKDIDQQGFTGITWGDLGKFKQKIW